MAVVSARHAEGDHGKIPGDPAAGNKIAPIAGAVDLEVVDDLRFSHGFGNIQIVNGFYAERVRIEIGSVGKRIGVTLTDGVDIGRKRISKTNAQKQHNA